MNPKLINNRYRLIREIGDGGFGKTYLVEDTYMPSGRRCVIKQLKPITNNPQVYQVVQARFQREAAILEELGEGSHQIPKLFGYFSEAGQFYLVQEWIEGQTLNRKVEQEGPLSESSVREILKSLLPVLEYVHNKRLVHRDIKPDNIILRDSDHQPVLIDFGAVRETMSTVMNSQGNPTHSIVIGSPGFMPSEQAVGRPVYSSDLYSLGLTMIYLLTGKLPQELETNHYNGEIIWQQHALSVSPSLAAVLDKAIKPNPQDRYKSAREMLEALQPSHYDPIPFTQQFYNQTVPDSPQGNFYSLPPTVINPPYPQPSPVAPTPPEPYYQPYQQGLTGGGGTFNTSVPIPPEISGWNWGAFLLSGFWCLNNQVWIGLLTWIPYIGLPMPFILGAKGNVWAWRSRHWRSVQDFKANQRAWAKAGAITWASIFALTFLAAIIGGISGKDTSNPTDTSSSSTSPSISTSPTQPSVSNSPTSSTGKFAQIKIDNLTKYTYPNQVFSMNVPGNWNVQDKTDSSRLFVEWLDSTRNGIIFIRMTKGQGTQTLEQLGSQLQDFLNSAYRREPDLNVGSPVSQPDNTSKIEWSFTTTASNGDKGTFRGDSYILQVGDKVAIVTFGAPEEQFNDLEPTFKQMFNTFQIQQNVALPS